MAEIYINGKHYHPATQLTWRDIHGELVAIDATTGEYHVFNEVGRFIWMAISAEKGDGQDVNHIVNEIEKQFNVSRQTASLDVSAFIDKLSGRGLLNQISN